MNFSIPKAKVVDDSSPIEESAKSGLSAKDGLSKDCLYEEELPNPLDRIIVIWNPPIINPPHITNVNP